MILESACIPLPSEVIMLTGGFFAEQGTFSFWGVVAAGVMGNVLGSILIFWIGAKGARSILDKYGRYVLINPKHMHQAEVWFSRYGEWAAFLGRNLPFIRTFISLPAGISRMNFHKFCIYTFLGCIPWNMALTYLGYKLGENWHIVESYIRPVTYVICALVLILVLRFLYKTIREKKKG
jgi:membrane protein DedA with SNARE-associated domain